MSLLRQMLSAIAAYDKLGIVHRDISTANVLVSDKHIRLIDFGLCYVDSGVQHTLAEEGIGTPNYMAPECEQGNLGGVTIRSDFYSVGKVIWAAVVNHEAFAREKAVFTHKSLHAFSGLNIQNCVTSITFLRKRSEAIQRIGGRQFRRVWQCAPNSKDSFPRTHLTCTSFKTPALTAVLVE